MPDVVPNRFALVAAAVVLAAGGSTAFAVAFPGRAAQRAVAPSLSLVATPAPTLPPPPAPTLSPTPVATAAPRVYTAPRRTTVVRAQPTRRPSGGGRSGDISQLPGPAQDAVRDQPQQPEQPDP